MKKCTIFICLDAFRHDYLSVNTTPFLCTLAQQGLSGRLETLLGFTGIYVSAFSSVYPETHGIWTLFHYDPSNSPFKWISSLSTPLSTLFGNHSINRYTRLLLSGLNSGVRYLLRGTRPEMIYDIPLRYLKYFDVSMTKALCQKGALGKLPTIFDALRDGGRSFIFLDWPLTCTNLGMKIDFRRHSDTSVCDKVKQYLKNDYHLYYFHLWDLDKVVHTYGANSKHVDSKLRELDDMLRDVIVKFRRRHSQVNIIVFSDHGMLDVKRTINIQSEVDRSALEPESDYLMFLDSTLARFWFRSVKARKIVVQILKDVKGGHILTKNELRRHRIDCSPVKYGEIRFLADPGVLIIPNYFQEFEKVKAMHGYDPLHPDQYGIFIGCFPRLNVEVSCLDSIKLVDVPSTLLEAMALPLPHTFEGKSLIQNRRGGEIV